MTFRPPLEESTSVTSVQEVINRWINGFLARSQHVAMLGPKVVHSCKIYDLKLFKWVLYSRTYIL